jgi:hypothetical protein
MAIDADGSVVSWARDDFGQVSNTPTGSGFTAIAGGGYHSVALVPEPTTALLLTLGLAGLGMRRRVR